MRIESKSTLINQAKISRKSTKARVRRHVFFTIAIFLLLSLGFISFATNGFGVFKAGDADILVTNTPNPTLIPTSEPVITTTSPTITAWPVTTPPAITVDKMIYYPVDKKTALTSDFVPANLVLLSSYNIQSTASSNKVRKEIVPDLQELYAAAKQAGFEFKVTSSYRSYGDQVATFNYWVGTEKAKGKNQQEAEAAANTYSAYPGHSEHQLGTTMDIDSVKESGNNLDATPANNAMWAWLDKNMEKYGFVLSYPEGKDDKTGYINEPWHIRWVGRDMASKILAEDYKNPNNSNTTHTYLVKVWDSLQ